MAKHKLKAYTINLFEDEIEADSLEKAKEIFQNEIEENKIICEETTEPIFDDEESFEMIESFFSFEEV